MLQFMNSLGAAVVFLAVLFYQHVQLAAFFNGSRAFRNVQPLELGLALALSVAGLPATTGLRLDLILSLSSDFTFVLLLDVCWALAASQSRVFGKRHIASSDLRFQLFCGPRSSLVASPRGGSLGGASVVLESRYFLRVLAGVQL